MQSKSTKTTTQKATAKEIACAILGLAVSRAKTKTSQKPNKKALRASRARRSWFIPVGRGLAVFSLILTLALIWSLVIEQLAPKQSAISATPANPPASTNYRELDLSLARKAGYSNSALRTVKDLGTVEGVNRSLVSFGVPKDGLFEYAYITKPAPAPAGGQYPVIILCHGYAEPEAYSTPGTYADDMDFYARHGFLVIKPDLRGQGLSLSKGSPDGAYYSMSYNTDIMSLIAALKKTSYVDTTAINLWGHSMGAYVALRAAVLSRDIRNVILLSTPGDVLEQARLGYIALSDRQNPVATAVRSQQLAIHGEPLTNTAYWDKTSPLNYLADSPAYFQVHVGSLDGVVPPVFSDNLDRKLSEVHKPHEYYVYDGSGHGLISERGLIWQRSLQVLTQR